MLVKTEKDRYTGPKSGKRKNENRKRLERNPVDTNALSNLRASYTEFTASEGNTKRDKASGLEDQSSRKGGYCRVRVRHLLGLEKSLKRDCSRSLIHSNRDNVSEKTVQRVGQIGKDHAIAKV